jgi:hypothetical protein
MAAEPQRPADHYASAVRLLATAESAGTDMNIAVVAALCALGHALLAGAPRRARRPDHAPNRPSGGPAARWIFGHDNR